MNNTIEVLSNQFEEGNVNAFASVAAEFGVTPAIYEEMASKAKPAVHLISATTDTDFSKLGGKPNLGPDFTWPCFNEKPMSFIGQFNLSDIPSVRDFDLPATGYLYFFYDQTNMAWGFNPEEKGSSKVIYVKEYAAIPAETAFPADLPETAQFQEKRIGFKKNVTFVETVTADILTGNEPDWEDEEYENFMSFSDSFFGGESVAKHQIGGNPLILQNAGMEIFCQLGAHGYSKRTVSPETEQKLTENCGEWVLLCQIDHDEDCGMNWEDDGRLYFWIKKTDLQACNFDNVWTILQCF